MTINYFLVLVGLKPSSALYQSSEYFIFLCSISIHMTVSLNLTSNVNEKPEVH